MQGFQKGFYRLPRFLLSSVATLLTLVQVALAASRYGAGPDAITWAGWISLWVAGVFAILPIITLRRKGEVPEGESYMKTTVLVDTGIYALVRHPQGGTAWILINLGLVLLAWHWDSVLFGLASMVLVYLDTFKTDQTCIEKFGDAYRRYIDRVPRLNPLVGIVRLLRSQRDN